MTRPATIPAAGRETLLGGSGRQVFIEKEESPTKPRPPKSATFPTWHPRTRMPILGPIGGPFGAVDMTSRPSRRKGARTKRACVNALGASGIAAERVPLAGAAGERFAGDVVLIGRDLCLVVKVTADSFREPYGRLSGRDELILKANRQEPLVVLRMALAAEIAKARYEPPASYPRPW